MSKYVAGIRVADGTLPYNLCPGEYCRRLNGWWVCCPGEQNGGGFLDDRWKVVEHESGVVSVTPSIRLVVVGTGGQESEVYHGYLTNGVWGAC